MKRWLRGLAVAVLVGVGCAPSTAASGTPQADQECTQAEVRLFAAAWMEIATRHFNQPPGSDALNSQASHIWNDCQFRFYDDNDNEGSPDNPEIPHVFSEDEYFLAGLFVFYFDVELSQEFDRGDAIADMKTATNRLFLGPSALTDDQLPEVALTYGPYRSGVLPHGPAVGNHRYAIFSPGTLAPGEYKWREEMLWPSVGGNETFVTYGTIIITPAP